MVDILPEQTQRWQVVESIARNVPVGLGEPVFDKLKADLAKGMMSIPATMGFQIGSGFNSTTMKASEHNDSFYNSQVHCL